MYVQRILFIVNINNCRYEIIDFQIDSILRFRLIWKEYIHRLFAAFLYKYNKLSKKKRKIFRNIEK